MYKYEIAFLVLVFIGLIYWYPTTDTDNFTDSPNRKLAHLGTYLVNPSAPPPGYIIISETLSPS